MATLVDSRPSNLESSFDEEIHAIREEFANIRMRVASQKTCGKGRGHNMGRVPALGLHIYNTDKSGLQVSIRTSAARFLGAGHDSFGTLATRSNIFRAGSL